MGLIVSLLDVTSAQQIHFVIPQYVLHVVLWLPLVCNENHRKFSVVTKLITEVLLVMKQAKQAEQGNFTISLIDS